MSRQVVASRYAGALFALAREQDLLSQVEGDLHALEDVLQTEPALGQVLTSQRITSDQKYKLIQKLFSEDFQQLTLNFLGVLLEKRREIYLKEIIAGFYDELDRFHGILQGEIRTAVELPESGRELLKEQLSRVTGKKMRLDYKVDPALIAGAVLKFGDKIIDGSVATRLKKMQSELMS